MKIAVTATGETQNSQVDPRFGRAAKFVLFDTDSHQVSAIDNAGSASASQGAGVEAANTISRMGADVVITGHCGPKALRALQAAGIELVIGAHGTVTEAIAKFESGELEPGSVDDADAHGRKCRESTGL